jgi:outer membrane protein
MKHAVYPLLLALWAAGLAQAQVGEPSLRLSRRLAQVPAENGEPAAPALDWAEPATRWSPGGGTCSANGTPPWEQLGLGDALAHALCQSPELRAALAAVAEQSAGVELGEVALRPSWNASADYSTARNFNASGSAGRTSSATLGLSWTLFDFGQRSAGLRSARQALAGAVASQDNALLESVRELLRLYGEAVVASASLEAGIEAEATASRTAGAAEAKYEAQVGSQIERLQAQTALAQATLERVRAQSSWENARAALALALGGEVDQPLRLADWERWARPGPQLPELAALRSETRSQHPRVRAALAQIQSLQARLQAVQAEGKGSVSISASGGTSRNWGAAGSGSIPAGNAAIVASIPFFNGRSTQAQQAQVLAQTAAQEAELVKIRREIDIQLWQAHQALLTSRQSLLASERLLASAGAAYQVAQGRYKAGVGSILELLNAQSALADARRQRVSAQVEQLSARTQLGLASGRIGL